MPSAQMTPTEFVSHAHRATFAHTWRRYRAVATGTEAVAAMLTLVLAGSSWLVRLTWDGDYVEIGAQALGWLGALTGLSVVARGAFEGLRRRDVNVDELVTIAIVASLVVGEYLGAALVGFMMLFGKVLEDVTATRAHDAIAALGTLVPATARIKVGPRQEVLDSHRARSDQTMSEGAEEVVAVADLRPGMTVLVRPGERLPVDGTVIGGQAYVDEATITGEPVPVLRTIGDHVFAGSIASGGALDITATNIGALSTIGRIASLVRDATEERAPIVRTADRWARWFTPTILVIAGVVWAWTGDFRPAVTVLVVACPCALTLATPTAIVATVARAAYQGLLVRGGARVELAGTITTVVFDKTGTLTSGILRVTQTITFGSTDARALVAIAAQAEARSEHPIGRAIVAEAAQGARTAGTDGSQLPSPRTYTDGQPPRGHQPDFMGMTPEARGENISEGTSTGVGFTAVVGAGVVAHLPGLDGEVVVGTRALLGEHGIACPDAVMEAFARIEDGGETAIGVGVAGQVIGVIGLADTVRPEAAQAVTDLRKLGVTRILLLTGDGSGPAHSVAKAVGIDRADVQSRLLPDAKLAAIRQLQATGQRVAMVGDGVNDGPAIAIADLGIAMGGAGSDLAMATADVVILADDTRSVAAVLAMSRRAMQTIRQNLVIATVWNVVSGLLAASGTIGVVEAALIHNIGSVGVVVNAARLIRLHREVVR